jgi:lysylphosphatidylglycerol synthetase-like protein (DUF2156 family)
MLGRALLAALLGAIVLMLWGMIYWVVLPFGFHVMDGADDEARLAATLTETLPASGVYLVPWLAEAEGGEPSEAAFEGFVERHRRGPIVQIFYSAEGREPMAPSVFVAGFVNFFTSAMIAVGVLALGLPLWPRFGQRVLVVFLLGLFAAVTVEMANPIWMHHAWDYSAYRALQHVSGWLLAGLAIAAVLKPRVVAPAVEEQSGEVLGA